MLVSVLTVAIYTIFFIKQFPSNGHLFFSLQLHDVSALFFYVSFSDFSIVVFDYMFYVSSATIAYFDAAQIEDFV